MLAGGNLVNWGKSISFYFRNMNEIIDSQIIAENVGFLDNCFDNSFSLQTSLNIVKEYVDEQNLLLSEGKQISRHKRKADILTQNLNLNNTCSAIQLQSQVCNNSGTANKNLKEWGLPQEIASKYAQRGIREMFDWQVKCLGNEKVLLNCCNLVYSAPTSAGKTLVAEILTIKTILERQKKVIIILPFVSIVREKMFYLQDILSSSGIRVEGFMGSQSPPGGLQAVHVAICTIEKANSLVNRLLDEGNISDLGAVIVDELHLLGDPHRGYILELLLTKIKYVSSKLDDVHIQIVGMSATLPNLEVLANWLDAELFVTHFRPIPLDEFCLVGSRLYDKLGKCVTDLDDTISGDSDKVLQICLNTIKDGCSVLIFCMTKNRCENLAQTISSTFFKLGCSGQNIGLVLRQQLNSEKISEVLEQLKNCPVGLDPVLKNTISFGVAYHHAGLTFDERDIIEGAFKTGAIRVLVATSTLSSGVNLPARKVIVRSPVFQRQPINILTYKQMIGRAGRMGKDSKGESILICTEAEKKIGFDLMMGALDPVRSCIESEDKYMRAVLEMIASQVACTKEELILYSKCTLLSAQEQPQSQNLLVTTIEELKNYELIRIQSDGDENTYVSTPLGKACLSSSMAPNDGLSLFCELQKARQCLVLETDLHLIYLVTPYSVSGQWGNSIDWLHLLTLWESLTKAMKRVGELVGVQESFIIRCLRGTNKLTNVQNKLNIHKRFYTALALQDLVNEVPLSEVAAKFQCARGFLQSLQQAAATFAGMVTAFCRQLGWKSMEMLVAQFQDRLHFGIHSELLELMKLPSLNGMRARSVFDAGFETIASIASADVNVIENTLHKAVPFQSERERDGDDSDDVRKRKKMKNIWITGCCGLTAKEAAANLINEARKYLEQEIGVSEIKWQNTTVKVTTVVSSSDPINHTNLKDGSTKELKPGISVATCDTVVKLETLTTEPVTLNGHNESIMNNTNDTDVSRNNCISNEREENPVNVCNESTTNIKIDPLISSSHELSNLRCSQSLNGISQGDKSPSILKDGIIWDSINFTEIAFESVLKNRLSNNTFSPDVTFGDTEDNILDSLGYANNVGDAKSNSVKDVSLFSSDGDTSSLFEDSLPLDLNPSKLLEDTNDTPQPQTLCQQVSASDFNMNSNTIINAFKTTVIESDDDEDHQETDDDEDIKLIYEEDKLSENELETGFNLSEDVEVTDTQETTVSSVNLGNTLKRYAEIPNEDKSQPVTKKFKPETNQNRETVSLSVINEDTDINLKHDDSKVITCEINMQMLKCFILRGVDIIENINAIRKLREVALYFNVNNTIAPASNEIIGNNIIKHTKNEVNKNDVLVKGIAVYFSQESCIFLDISSARDNFTSIKTMLSDWLNKCTNIRLLEMKSSSVYMQKSFNIELNTSVMDISLAEWLMDSDEKIPNMMYLTKKYCELDLTTTSIKINGKRTKFKNLSAVESSCIKSMLVWHIANKQDKYLMEQYHSITEALKNEIDIAKILSNCEYYGVTVDKSLASQLLIDVKNSQETLQKKAYQICGYHFNFNSSKDVAKVLGIYNGRRVSTKKSVLTSHNSPMASIVIYWRKLNSILTKTLYPLAEKACIYSAGDRITPTYTMYTCTGRISMHAPNLQNVPRTFSIPCSFFGDTHDEGVMEFNCRNIFRAAPGCVLVSADYCQLEMRILTHYCGDDVLTGIMRSDVDVFKSIAAAWGNVSESKVDDDLRQKAKQLCYGILYGMGNKTLAQNLDVNELEAAAFMEAFHAAYPAIRVFTQALLEECRGKGYVETLMKRRRYLPDVNCKVVARRSAAERQAVNTTIQGSAADIAKAAMRRIASASSRPRLILQMHDELIYEVPQNSRDTFARTLKLAMETTVRLKVPLPVKVRAGCTWGTLQEMKL